MEKMSRVAEIEKRAELYDIACKALNDNGYQTEPIKDGSLIHLGDGYYARVKFSICDATKFDIDRVREEYNLILEERAAHAALMEKKAKLKQAHEAAKATEAVTESNSEN